MKFRAKKLEYQVSDPTVKTVWPWNYYFWLNTRVWWTDAQL